MMGKALDEIIKRLTYLHAMDLDGDATGRVAKQAFDGINYLKWVTSWDETAQESLDDICQYIIHIEHKWLGKEEYDGRTTRSGCGKNEEEPTTHHVVSG